MRCFFGAKKLMESRTPPPKRPRANLGPLVKTVAAAPEDVAVTIKAFGTVRASVVAAFDSLYVIGRRDGRWAVAARSSFAP